MKAFRQNLVGSTPENTCNIAALFKIDFLKNEGLYETTVSHSFIVVFNIQSNPIQFFSKLRTVTNTSHFNYNDPKSFSHFALFHISFITSHRRGIIKFCDSWIDRVKCKENSCQLPGDSNILYTRYRVKHKWGTNFEPFTLLQNILEKKTINHFQLQITNASSMKGARLKSRQLMSQYKCCTAWELH